MLNPSKEFCEVMAMINRIEMDSRRAARSVRAEMRLRVTAKRLHLWLKPESGLLEKYRKSLEDMECYHKPLRAFRAGQDCARSGSDKNEAFRAYAATISEEAFESLLRMSGEYMAISEKLKSRRERAVLDKYTAAYRAVHSGITKSIDSFFMAGYERG